MAKSRLAVFDAGVLLGLDRGESVEHLSKAFRVPVAMIQRHVDKLESRGLAKSGRTTAAGRNALKQGGWL